jgi:hypothetical protein
MMDKVEVYRFLDIENARRSCHPDNKTALA